MAGMNSGVSAYQEDAVIRQDAAEQQARERLAESRARQSAAAAVDPTGALLVTYGHERLCIDCAFCRDWGMATPPAFLVCENRIVKEATPRKVAPCCVTARSLHFDHASCGPDAVFFEDALA